MSLVRRRCVLHTLTLITITCIFTTPVAAQQPEIEYSPSQGAAVSMIVTFIVAGIFVFFRRSYTRQSTRQILDHPFSAFFWGILMYFIVTIFASVLVVYGGTLGFLLTLILLLILFAVGQLGYLAFGRAASNGWKATLIVAVLLSGITGVLGIVGILAASALSILGIGGAYLQYKSDGDTERDGIGNLDKSPWN